MSMILAVPINDNSGAMVDSFFTAHHSSVVSVPRDMLAPPVACSTVHLFTLTMVVANNGLLGSSLL